MEYYKKSSEKNVREPTMPVELREVTGRRLLREFIRFPLRLYHRHPYYVPALYRDELGTLSATRNPAFQFCRVRLWLAYRGGEVVGRIAAILNQRHEEKWGRRQVRFGWIDFIDDSEVSAALLTAVESWARELGAESVHGPLGFTDFDREGMLIEGFEELGTMASIYNYPYYPRHLEALGYHKDVDWVEYQIIRFPVNFRKIFFNMRRWCGKNTASASWRRDQPVSCYRLLRKCLKFYSRPISISMVSYS